MSRSRSTRRGRALGVALPYELRGRWTTKLGVGLLATLTVGVWGCDGERGGVGIESLAGAGNYNGEAAGEGGTAGDRIANDGGMASDGKESVTDGGATTSFGGLANGGSANAGSANAGSANAGLAGSSLDNGGYGGRTVAAAGGGGGAEPLDPKASRQGVYFPPPVSYTDASRLTVRGWAEDSDGVISVLVNDTPAVSTDGFRSWQAGVAIAAGANAFAVTVTDALGHATKTGAAFSVTNHGTSLVNVQGMDFDPESGSVLASDFRLDAIVRIDSASGMASILSSRERGVGAAFKGSRALAVDALNRRVLAFSWGDDVLLSIDLKTGTRSVVSPGSTTYGTPTSLVFASGLALDQAHGRAFAVASPRIIAIDLSSGLRSVLTGGDVGVGAPVMRLTDVVYDDVTTPLKPRLLVSDTGAATILAIDPSSGGREIFSGNQGRGLAFAVPGRMRLDAARRRLLVVDGTEGSSGRSSYNVNRSALVAVDLSSGDRETLSDPFVGSGFVPEAPFALALDARNGRAFIANDWGGEIVTVDLANQTRRLLSDSSIGEGATLLDPVGLALLRTDQAPSELMVADALLGSLLRLDVATGNRSELSGRSRGKGPALGFTSDVIVEPRPSGPPQRAFLADASLKAVLGVDLATGDRVEISGPNVGVGPAIGGNNGLLSLQGVALDAPRNRLLMVDSYPAALTAIDLDTGDRTLISNATQGAGPALIQPNGVVLDPSSSSTSPSAFVMCGVGVLRVDLSTGDRSLFSALSPAVGVGFPLFGPQRAVLDPTPGSTLLVSDYFGFLAGVRLDNGNRGLLSGQIVGRTDPPLGTGPSLDAAGAIQADLAHRVAYLADSTRGAILAIDLPSGDRVLMSR